MGHMVLILSKEFIVELHQGGIVTKYNFQISHYGCYRVSHLLRQDQPCMTGTTQGIIAKSGKYAAEIWNIYVDAMCSTYITFSGAWW